MTDLTHAEFDPVLAHFQSAWNQYVQHNYIDRDDRQRQYGGGKSESTLVNIEDKLLFILYYVKVYPLQEILAFEFDMVQSKVIFQEPFAGTRRFQFIVGQDVKGQLEAVGAPTSRVLVGEFERF
jgi:hypothetical protein